MFVRANNGSGGGGDNPDGIVYGFSYTNPNIYVTKNGETVATIYFNSVTTYEDDNIVYTDSSSRITLQVKKKARLYSGNGYGAAAQNPSYAVYNAGDYVLNNDARYYQISPYFLQILNE